MGLPLLLAAPALAAARGGLAVVAYTAVARTPSAGDIEAFKREACRIKLLVAALTRGVRTVEIELLADGLGSTDVVCDRPDARRWGWDFYT